MTELRKFKMGNGIIGIMAATSEGVIGINKSIPWNYQDELEHFRLITHGHTIIMGRKTYEAIPKNVFANRRGIVFSRNPMNNEDSVVFVKSLSEYFDITKSFKKSEKIFMIGGAEIAHLFLEHKLISSFILTRINHLYSGDTYLNLNYFKGWTENILKLHPNYTIFQLTNHKEVL